MDDIKEVAVRVAGRLEAEGVEPGWAHEVAANFTMVAACSDGEPLNELAVEVFEQRWAKPGAGRGVEHYSSLPARERFAELGRVMAEAYEGV